MVVQRQYADKGVGIQKRPPPPPKINVDNLIVDDKVKSSEKKTRTKKKVSKKSKSSVPLIGVARCEVSRDVLQSREPESSHKRSSGTSNGDRRQERNADGHIFEAKISPSASTAEGICNRAIRHEANQESHKDLQAIDKFQDKTLWCQ
jgi:hypothetical protein